MDIKDKELHRIVITAIIYNRERKYLITKRSPKKKAFPGKWTVPGGGLTVDDYIHEPTTHGNGPQWYNALEKTLRREVKEEVNLEIGKPEYLVDLAFIRPDGIPVITLSYFAPHKSGEAKILDDESIDYAWVTLKEAKTYDLIDGIYGEIEEVDTILRSREKKN